MYSVSPISKDLKSYYFETKIERKGDGDISIGLSRSTTSNTRPGNSDASIGLHIYDGSIARDFDGNKKRDVDVKNWLKIEDNDTIGCMIRRVYNGDELFVFCYFTKNGERLDPVIHIEDNDYYPIISVYTEDASFIPNLGDSTFLYDNKGNFSLLEYFIIIII